jgi:hypothetical protein
MSAYPLSVNRCVYRRVNSGQPRSPIDAPTTYHTRRIALCTEPTSGRAPNDENQAPPSQQDPQHELAAGPLTVGELSTLDEASRPRR